MRDGLRRWTGLMVAAASVLWLGDSPAQADLRERPGIWAHTYAGRPVDPAVRFGQLPSGLRYAVLRNTTPSRQVAIWMRMGVGSLDETDAERGFAHFLEHMAFKGSTRVPTGNMVEILQRLGLEFGPDTNAETGQDQTVYKLTFPENDPESIATGLMLLREIGSELTIAPEALEPEKGVVLAEERLRDGPSNQAHTRQQGFVLDGLLAARRMPIGKRDVIAGATAEAMRAFYHRTYRPERATLVVVGDVDADSVVTQLEQRFGDWTAASPPQPDPDLGQVAARGPSAASHVQPGVPELLSLSWVSPYDPTADTSARETRDMAEVLAMQVLNRRLGALAETADPPLVVAQGGRSNALRSIRLSQIGIQGNPGGWRRAVDATIAEQRRLVAGGVAAEELARELAWVRTYLLSQRDGADTRQTPALAEALVRTVNDDDVFSSPAQDVAEFEAMAPALTVDAINAAARRLFAGSGPLLFVSSPRPIDGGDAALLAALREALDRPLETQAATASLAWPYGPAPVPGVVAERRRLDDLDVEQVRFANNVRLIVKSTSFAKDQVLVGVRVGRGRLDLAGAPDHALWTIAGPSPVLTFGGTRELTSEQIRALTAGQVVDVNVQLGDEAFTLSGTTRPADLDTQLQLLQALVTRPGLRAAAYERVKKAVANQVAQVDSTAMGVFGMEKETALRGGDPRWNALPRPDALARSTAADVARVLAKPLAEGPLEVTVVGDIAVDRVVASVANTFGALPPRPLRPMSGAVDSVASPALGGPPLVFRHAGRADQAVAMQSWITQDYFADPQAQRVLGLLSELVTLRLTAAFRTADGSTYSPTVTSNASDTFKGMGDFTVTLEMPADRIDTFYARLDAIMADLRDQPPSPDELERARKPRLEQRLRWLQNNVFWFIVLSGAHADEREYDAIRAIVPGLKAITAEDLRDAARRWLVPERSLRMMVVPQAAAAR